MNIEAATLRGWSLSGLSDCFYQDQDTLSYDTVNLDVQVTVEQFIIISQKCYSTKENYVQIFN